MAKKNWHSLEKYNSKAAPGSPLEKYLIELLIRRIQSKSVYGTTKLIGEEFNLRHTVARQVLAKYATPEAGYVSWRPAQKHKVYRPSKPTFSENCSVYWS